MVPDEAKQHGNQRSERGDEEIDFHGRDLFGSGRYKSMIMVPSFFR